MGFFCLHAYALTVYKSVDKAGSVTFSGTKILGSIPVTLASIQTISIPKQTLQTSTEQSQVDINNKVNSLLSLRKAVNLANNNYVEAQKNHNAASTKALLAKRELNVAIANAKLKNNQGNDSYIFSVSQLAVLAEQQKQRAYVKLQQAEQQLQTDKAAVITFLQK